MTEPVPQARFRDLVKAVCEGCYSAEDLRRYGPLEDWDVSQATPDMRAACSVDRWVRSYGISLPCVFGAVKVR